MNYFELLKPLLFKLAPEDAHRLVLRALSHGLVPSQKPVNSPMLYSRVSGLNFHHPVGLAAGFDKNAEAVAQLFRQGFSFVECGTVTPRPQAGNEKPRMFRLEEDEAVINRLGFNNAGLDALQMALQRQQVRLQVLKIKEPVVGVNIGKNKDSDDAVGDYISMLDGVAQNASYVTLNISSPNTPGLRDLQTGSALAELLEGVCEARERLRRRVPLWLKLAPDLSDEQCGAIAETIRQYPLDALIISNTTVSRSGHLASVHSGEPGGLSGKPLMQLATDRLALFYGLTGGKLPLVGVGGIASAEDAYAKIRSGASLVQLYSSLVYQGFGLVTDIKRGLIRLLERDGFNSLQKAVGIDVKG